MHIQSDPTRPGLQLVHDDGRVLPIHPLWLRERCDDAANIDRLTGQRLYDPNDLPEDLAVQEVASVSPGTWRVVFSDGARAEFGAAAILAETLPASAAMALPAPLPWTGTLSPLPVLAWPPGPDGMRPMLEAFLRLGFVILRGVPSESGAILTVARRFGFPRDTNFGVMFDVRSVPDAIDLAYTGLFLDPHTDNPYRDPVPGVQLLHCLMNKSSGGYSTLVDGLAVTQALRARDAAAYHILATTPVRFRYADSATELAEYAPILAPHDSGQIAIRFSPRLDFVPLLEESALDAFYRARRTLDHMLRAPEFSVKFLLQAGDLMMFDNRRLLHGRTGFDPQEGERHLQGCYIDIDGPRSLYRVLSRAPAQSAAAE